MAEKFEQFAPFFQVWKTVADEANALRTEYIAATANQDEAVKALLDTSDDATVVQWREFDKKIGEKIAELVAKRDEAKASVTKHAQSLVPGVDPKKAEEIKSTFLTKRKAATATRDNILLLLGNDEAALKAGIDAYQISEVTNLRGGKGGAGGTGTGPARPRIASATVDGEAFAKDGKVTYTLLASHLKVTGDDLRNLVIAAAGVESIKDVPAGTTVSIDVKSGDKVHKVTVTTPEENASANAEAPEGNTEGDADEK